METSKDESVAKRPRMETQNVEKIIQELRMAVCDRYSFGISIGRYIGLANKRNVLSVSADTVFYIGS